MKLLRRAWTALAAPIYRRRYARVLARVAAKKRGEKIRVLFVVSEIAKWKEQRLYEAMESSGVFEPVVALSAWNAQNELCCSNERLLDVLAEAEAFFDRLGDRHVRSVAVENGVRKVSDLREFSPDVVFYTEPWYPCGRQGPECVSRFALTCHLPYYVPVWGDPAIVCRLPLHRRLWKYYVQNRFWADYLRENSVDRGRICEYVATGHPALDYFTEARALEAKPNRVVYAPHFSFPHPKHDYLLQFISTFPETGEAMLEYARNHPEIEWVFKPHPILRHDLESTGLWTREQIDAYYGAWERLGRVSYDGDYQELFMKSRCLVTDSGSFLLEYGATGSPVIQLVGERDPGLGPEPTRRVLSTYYRVRGKDELAAILAQIVERGEDPRRAERLAAVREADLLGNDASAKIVADLRREFAR